VTFLTQRPPRVAIIHDWLTGMRGGEKCLEYFLQLYPYADLYTLLHTKGTTSSLIESRVTRQSFLGALPHSGKWYRLLLPFYPSAVKSFSLSSYDLVISLSHAAAKNVRSPRGTRHVCYCFTPMRYIWDQAQAYLGSFGSQIAAPLIYALRQWDRRGADSVDTFVAISTFIAARIRRFYHRKSVVLYPPVATHHFSSSLNIPKTRTSASFLYAGALVPYKFPDRALEVARRLSLPLTVAGDGPMRDALQREFGASATFVGRVADSELATLYRKSRALLFPGVEDFGMMPVECLSLGTPIVGIYKGGLREILGSAVHREFHKGTPCMRTSTGVRYVSAPNSVDKITHLENALTYFLSHETSFSEMDCRARAAVFSPLHFLDGWKGIESQYYDEASYQALRKPYA
jgi:glycosyltransferase involved in cell wall biosynthesis